MARGGGSANGSARSLLLGMAMVWLVVLRCSVVVEGNTYVVGDAQGWGFQIPYARWAARKPFRAGDTLVFNYAVGAHNVVPVNSNGYKTCKALGGARPLTSGSDRVTLKRGLNYYICSFPGHCAGGMKIVVKAT